jgi:hypothetical protein
MTDSTGFKSIKSIVHHISQLANAYECTLPNEIILKNIATFFTVKPLNPDRTKAVSCSSTSGQYSLDHSLIDSESSWWISSTGTFRNGTSIIFCILEFTVKTKILYLSYSRSQSFLQSFS